MKKFIALLIALAALLSFTACGGKDESKSEDTTEKPDTTAALTMPESTKAPETAPDTTAVTTEAGEIGTAAAVEAAKAFLGATDPDTGYKYAYSYDSRFTDNGTEYYKIRASWYLEDEDRYSLCGYLLVTLDGKSVTKFGW